MNRSIMTVKQLFISIVVYLMAGTSAAVADDVNPGVADFPMAMIRATYHHTALATRPYNGEEFKKEDDFMLQIASGESRFCSMIQYDYEKFMASDEGKALAKEILRRATVYDSDGNKKGMDMSKVKDIKPKRGSHLVVRKRYADKVMEIKDHLAFEYVKYMVPMDDQIWEIADSVKSVLGYECQMAVSDYHGRRWIAWFAPEIPVQDGPWQLFGLPGLIMEAESEGGEYSFVITGIEKVDEPILPMAKKRDFVKTDRISFLKDRHELLEDPAKLFGGHVWNADGRPMGKVNLLHDLIETDYK